MTKESEILINSGPGQFVGPNEPCPEDLVTLGLQVLSLVGSRLREAFNQNGQQQTPVGGNIVQQQQQIKPKSRRPSSAPIQLPSTVAEPQENDQLPVYSLQEVSNHDSHFDCWTVINDLVYDISLFLDLHPGGDEIILEYAGRDSTLAFKSVGHSGHAEKMLEPYLIGILPENERIWNCKSIFSWGK